jgi:hypothetical protein
MPYLYFPGSVSLFFCISHLAVCVSRVWAGADSVWEQEKPEARKMLIEGAADSRTSGALFVGRLFVLQYINFRL